MQISQRSAFTLQTDTKVTSAPQSKLIRAKCRPIYWLFWRWKHLICVFNDTNGVCFADYITSITFQHIWKRKNVSMLCIREVWMCLCWVCLLLSLRLASVCRASRVGHSRGQRSEADELVTVAARGWTRGLFPWIFVCRWTVGSSGDFVRMCLADVVLFWVCRDPWRASWTTVTRPVKTQEERNSLKQLWEQHVFSFECKGEWKWLSLSFPWQLFQFLLEKRFIRINGCIFVQRLHSCLVDLWSLDKTITWSSVQYHTCWKTRANHLEDSCQRNGWDAENHYVHLPTYCYASVINLFIYTTVGKFEVGKIFF